MAITYKYDVIVYVPIARPCFGVPSCIFPAAERQSTDGSGKSSSQNRTAQRNCGRPSLVRRTGCVKSVDFHAREGQAPSGRLFLTGADHHQPTGKAQKPSLPYGIALGIRQYGRLVGFDYLLRLASVGCAASLSFARVFTRMLATALALAVVLTFARVFR